MFPHSIPACTCVLSAAVALLALSPLQAEVFGLFTYQINGSTVTITDYPTNATGPVVVPAQIDGRAVSSIGPAAFQDCVGITSVELPQSITGIGENAFERCTALTSAVLSDAITLIANGAFRSCANLSVLTLPSGLTGIGNYAFSNCSKLPNITIPASVTTIGQGAFSSCSSLTSVSIPAATSIIGLYAWSRCSQLTEISVSPSNPVFTSVQGVLLNKSQTRLIQYPSGRTSSVYSIPAQITAIGESAFDSCTALSSVTIPEGVTTIGFGAFFGCAGLTKVILPSTLSSIGFVAFDGCSLLEAAAFTGNAPTVDSSAFANTAAGFTIFYLSSRSGFSSPTWQGYPATAIDETTYPAAPWLLGYGYWYDTDMNDDPEGDGVTLLTAYALDLDPTVNQSGSLPQPVFTDSTISLTFPADSPGVTYLVKTSTDLQSWTTEGVSQSGPGSDGKATATIARTGIRQFLALFLEY